MRELAIIAILAVGFSMAPNSISAVAQHHAAKEKAKKQKTDAARYAVMRLLWRAALERVLRMAKGMSELR